MSLKVTFGGPLVRYKPENAKGNTAIVDNVVGLNLINLLQKLGVPEEQRLLTILNGTVIPSDAYLVTILSDGDDLALMPPIQAG